MFTLSEQSIPCASCQMQKIKIDEEAPKKHPPQPNKLRNISHWFSAINVRYWQLIHLELIDIFSLDQLKQNRIEFEMNNNKNAEKIVHKSCVEHRVIQFNLTIHF